MMFRKTITLIWHALRWTILLLLVLFFVIYAIAPVYDFPDCQSFSGDKIHNPYEGLDSSAWKKGNFQVQSRAWWGLTAGSKNSNEAIQAVYRHLGYDIITTSDYMRINTFGKGNPDYIPAYEHGYGISKYHQVCLGTSRVNWIDYPFYQNVHHKQHILNILRNNNELVTIAHPRLRNAYSYRDMQLLSGYDLIEALNQIRFSVSHWDAVLSAGHAVYILANDDAHDIYNPYEVGRVCTFINTPGMSGNDIIMALKSGKSFGADIKMPLEAKYAQKSIDHKNIPSVRAVQVVNDTLFVEVSREARQIDFIGQNGAIKQRIYRSSSAQYRIKPDDTYIRTEIEFPNETKFYLNPVFRYSGNVPAKPPLPEVNLLLTWLQRVVALVLIGIATLFVWKLRKRNLKPIPLHQLFRVRSGKV